MSASPEPSVPEQRVLIVDDQPLMREGIARMLGRLGVFQVCEAADCIAAARERMMRFRPGLVVMELSLGSGDAMDFLKSFKGECPETRVLIYTALDEMLFAERALHAGAAGYLMKQDPAECFVEAVRAVSAGDLYVSRRISAWLLRRRVGNHLEGASENDSTLGKLTDRELHVFRLLGSGLSTRNIALDLNLSVKTVEAHREHIKHKLGLANGASLNRMAMEWVRDTRSPARVADS
jgi:DNA-binding NarL/FixJ family response regulator